MNTDKGEMDAEENCFWNNADTLSGETYTTDNTFTYGWVSVSIVGDVNGNRKVDLKDVFAVGLAFNAHEGQPRYKPNFDLNSDGKIDLKDYFPTCKNYGKTWS